VYVSVLVEHGIQGCLALLAMVFGMFVYLRREYVRAETDEKRALALGLMGWWAAHAIAHFFISAFFDVLIIGQFWMLLACLACMESPAPGVGAPAARPV
jgi:O-antigen ligase